MRTFAFVLAVSLVVPLSFLTAQNPPPLEPGARVRVTHCGPLAVYSGRKRTDCRTTQGNLVAMTSDSVVLNAGASNERLSVPRDLMTRLRVTSGQRGRAGRGALIGTLVGVGAGAGFGIASCAMLETGCYEPPTGAVALGTGIFGGIAGVLVGATVGAFIKTDRWEEVPLDRLRVSFAPQRNGFSLGVSFAF